MAPARRSPARRCWAPTPCSSTYRTPPTRQARHDHAAAGGGIGTTPVYLSANDRHTASAARQRARGAALVVWQAARGRTVLTDLRQEGCLKLRFPRGEKAEATLLNSSGGVAAGDRLMIESSLGVGAEAAISTQAAERIYRALPDDGPARIAARLTLEPGATLDWLPQETILFDGCALDRQLDVTMHHSACFLGIESLVFGRAAMGETVRCGTLDDRIRIRRDGALIWHDAIRLHGPIAAILQRPAVAAGRRAVATLVQVAPRAEAQCDTLRAALAGAPGEAGVSAWNGMLVARLLADSSLLLRRMVLTCLAALGRAPPRVWSC